MKRWNWKCTMHAGCTKMYYTKNDHCFSEITCQFSCICFFPFLFNATRLTSWKVICLCTTADRHLGHVNFGNLLMEFGDRRCCIFVGKPGWESPRELLTWTLDLKHGPQWVCWAFTSDYSIALDAPTFMGMIQMWFGRSLYFSWLRQSAELTWRVRGCGLSLSMIF